MVRTIVLVAVMLSTGVLVGTVQAQKGGFRGGGGAPRNNAPAPRFNNVQPNPRVQPGFQPNAGGPRFIWVTRTYRTNNNGTANSGGDIWPFLILGFFGVCLVTGIIFLIVHFCTASATNPRERPRRFADNPA